VLGTDEPYEPVGDASSVADASGTTHSLSLSSAVKQRFRHKQDYACLAYALFNLTNAPHRYEKRMKCKFRESVASMPVFRRFLAWLQETGHSLATCGEAEQLKSVNWLLEQHQGLAIISFDGHAYGFDFTRKLIFDGTGEYATRLDKDTLYAYGFRPGLVYECISVVPRIH